MEKKNKEEIKIKDKKENIRNIVFWIAIFLLTILFSYIAYNVVMDKITPIDTAVYDLVISLKSTGVTNVVRGITFLCSEIFMISLAIILLVIVKNKGISLRLVLNMAGAALLNKIVKVIFARPRPVGINLVEESGYSFPSGHSMISFAFYGYVVYLIYTKVQNKCIKWISITILTVLIPLIGLSRVYLGVHYISDVIGGFVLGLIYLMLFTKYVKER